MLINISETPVDTKYAASSIDFQRGGKYKQQQIKKCSTSKVKMLYPESRDPIKHHPRALYYEQQKLFERKYLQLMVERLERRTEVLVKEGTEDVTYKRPQGKRSGGLNLVTFKAFHRRSSGCPHNTVLDIF